MKSFNSKMRKKLFRQTVGDEVMKAAEIYDLTMLWTVRENCKFGAERLRKFYADFCENYRYMRDRYYCEGDEETFGSRTDAYVIKERLKEIGFDYDKEVKELTEGADDEQS